MIIQNTSRDGEKTDMTFTVPRADLDQTIKIIDEIKETLGTRQTLYDERVSKVSVIGVGMRSHSGVASRMFQALKAEGINILMISTSEIKVTCLIEEKYTELAVRTLHESFELEKEGMKC
jgi:aspartate kinase